MKPDRLDACSGADMDKSAVTTAEKDGYVGPMTGRIKQVGHTEAPDPAHHAFEGDRM
ncbi:hypothetical protein [Mesorhizobium sp.]|uniref:hypothetical protein n=1 Tax=Mesorhizobium sp. TaxID=1871066 RepID=UPI00257EB20D|nr:hypothetical protein [Mesorhizobium sp.]